MNYPYEHGKGLETFDRKWGAGPRGATGRAAPFLFGIGGEAF